MKYFPSVSLKICNQRFQKGVSECNFLWSQSIYRRLGRCFPNGQSERLAHYIRSIYPERRPLCRYPHIGWLSGLLVLEDFILDQDPQKDIWEENLSLVYEIDVLYYKGKIDEKTNVISNQPNLIILTGNCAFCNFPQDKKKGRREQLLRAGKWEMAEIEVLSSGDIFGKRIPRCAAAATKENFETMTNAFSSFKSWWY